MKFKKVSSLALSFAILASSLVVANASGSYTRVSGSDRFKTSIESAKYVDSDVVVFANGYKFQDALSAINICNSQNAKLILVDGTTDFDLNATDMKKAYIVGGSEVVSDSFQKSLEDRGIEVVRLAGLNRYETNQATLKEAKYEEFGLASGDQFADALSASRLLKDNRLGLLLANKNNVKTISEGKDIRYVLGGPEALPFDGAERISGSDRYQTSARIADRTEAKNVVLVNGSDFADALSAVNIANAREADVVLAPKKVYSSITEICSGSEETFIVGGNLSVTSNMIDIAIDGVDPTPVRNVVARLDKAQIEKEGGKYFIRDLDKDDYVTYAGTKDGFISFGNKTFILESDGAIAQGFVNKNGETYYSEPTNGLRRGWTYVNKSLYYFSPSDYKMYKNGIKSTGEGAYWFAKDGKLTTGSRPQGHRGKRITWYGPSQAELSNQWLRLPNAKARFKGQEIVNFATQFDGLPFKWFGNDLRDRSGVYCCGAVYSAYKEFGIHIPGPNDCNMRADNGYRMVKAQYLDGRKFGGRYIATNFKNMWPGDISYTAYGNGYSHAALYLGMNGGRPMTIHATLADGYIAEPLSIIHTWNYHYLNAMRYVDNLPSLRD